MLSKQICCYRQGFSICYDASSPSTSTLPYFTLVFFSNYLFFWISPHLLLTGLNWNARRGLAWSKFLYLNALEGIWGGLDLKVLVTRYLYGSLSLVEFQDTIKKLELRGQRQRLDYPSYCFLLRFFSRDSNLRCSTGIEPNS